MAATNVQSGDVGLNSPNSQRGVSSSWSQIVRRGGGEPEVIAPVVVAMELIAKCIESSDFNPDMVTPSLRLSSQEGAHNLEQQSQMKGSASSTRY
ncbi:hypothetical protein L2E82_14263 [Cichorium intybus]|uniref:Uncharacterized protein n=1 Tax=Cichorium intybus TaxID=13427 RepID=A0ACB9EZJ7_CICIN|nr:hypothetical protein L2E82_14263 [Cichorium intybus]